MPQASIPRTAKKRGSGGNVEDLGGGVEGEQAGAQAGMTAPGKKEQATEVAVCLRPEGTDPAGLRDEGQGCPL